MANEKIGIDVNLNAKNASQQLGQLTQNLKKFNGELEKNREGVKVIDSLTGGAATTFINLKKSVTGGIAAVKGLALSFKGLKTAILATGIGAIVVALGLIAAYWDDIKELVSGISAEQEELLATQKQQTELTQQQLDNISATENILKLQGKSEKDILILKNEQSKEVIKSLEAQLLTQKQLKKDAVETANRNKLILQGILALLTAPISLLLGAIDGVTAGLEYLGVLDEGTSLLDNFTGSIAELVFDPEEIAAEGDAAIEETEKQLTKLKNQQAGFQLQLNKIDDDNEKKRQKKRDDDAAEEQKKKDKELADEKKRLEDIQKIRDDFKRKIEDEAAEDEVAKLELEKQRKLKELEDLEATEADKAEVIAFYAKKIKDAQDEADAEDKARDEAIKQQKIAIIGQTFGAIADILGKNSVAGKAAAIAAATINAYQGVSEVFANKSTLPQPFATIEKIASAATILAAGIKTVRQIKSTPRPAGVKGGGGGGGSTPTPIPITPPAFNIVGASGTNQLTSAIAAQTNIPSRAYVVSSDVTTAQQLERNTIDGASLS